MTRSESEAIQALLALVQSLERQIGGMEQRLCAKLEKSCARMDVLEQRCEEREQHCQSVLEQRKQMFESEIAEAQQAAVLAAREPSIYWQATRGVAGTVLKFAAAISLLVGVTLGIFTLVGAL